MLEFVGELHAWRTLIVFGINFELSAVTLKVIILDLTSGIVGSLEGGVNRNDVDLALPVEVGV